jgi:putative ABC transport system permease protein
VEVFELFGAVGFDNVERQQMLETIYGRNDESAQRALDKLGRLDRIQVYQPEDEGERDWQGVIQAALPAGVEIATIGSAAEENKKMLGAFRWNLRVLSYLSLIVGALIAAVLWSM